MFSDKSHTKLAVSHKSHTKKDFFHTFSHILTQKFRFLTHSHTFSHKKSEFSHKIFDSHTKPLKILCWGKKKGTFGWGNFPF
jgi:hypothetical protein